jgi:uncharacterized protein (DUF2225 family)
MPLGRYDRSTLHLEDGCRQPGRTMTMLRDITLQCPICATWFVSTAVARSGSPAGTRTDFHERVNGAQPLRYSVHLCPACGFAGPSDEFSSDDVGAPSATALSEQGAARATSDAVAGSEKYEAAAAVATRRGAGPRQVADLLIRAGWCCAEEADPEGERYFRREAARMFESALARYDEVGRDERAVITYLVGELWRRIGDRARAARWFEQVPNEVCDSASQRWVVDLAAQQRDDPREWLVSGARGSGRAMR